MNSNRLAGHVLPQEGRVWHLGVQVARGATRCSCGELSPSLDSDAARKRWHRKHKDAIRVTTAAGGAEGDQSNGGPNA